MVRGFWLAWVALSLVACGGDDDGGDDGPAGRGTPACNEWQDSLCDFLSKCGGSADDISTCRTQVAAVTCKSDEVASNCATTLRGNACTVPPTGCDFRDLADPAPAQAACEQFTDAACSAAERCGESKAECLADPAITGLCTGAVAYTLAFEQCIQELGTLSCTATAAPASCKGVILK